MTLTFAAKTDVGRVRSNNEDSFAVNEALSFFIVADGMGGHNSGEVASRMACDVITQNLSRSLEKRETKPEGTQVMFGPNDPAISDTANRLVSSVRLANQVIFEASQNYEQNRGMGTTVAAALVSGGKYFIAWVGDSRVYLVRHGHIEQMTVDHSLVQEQIRRGMISSAEAETSTFKNVLTRALGTQANVEVDVLDTPVFDDDYLLLCSDGLTRMVSDQDILSIVQSAKEPQAVCDGLIAKALEAGGKDNVTAVVVHNVNDTVWDRLVNAIKSL